MRVPARSSSSRKSNPAPEARTSYHRAVSSASMAASGWTLTGSTGFRPGAAKDGLPRNQLHGSALHLRKPAADLFLPGDLDIRFGFGIQAGDKPPGNLRSLFRRQSERLLNHVAGFR